MKNKLQHLLSAIAEKLNILKLLKSIGNSTKQYVSGQFGGRCCNQENGLSFKILRWWNKNVNKKTYYYKIKKYLPIKNYYVMRPLQGKKH